MRMSPAGSRHSIFSTERPTVMRLRAPQPSNVSAGMVFTPSPMVIRSRVVHPLNTPLPNSVTDAGMTSNADPDVWSPTKLVQSANA